MADKFIAAWRDYDNDRQEVSYPVINTATPANFATFVAAIEAYTIGVGGGGGFYDEISADPGIAAATAAAQNSLQLIIEVRDTVTGNYHTYRAPCVDLAKANDVGANLAWVPQNGVTVANQDHADYATLKTQIESFLLSKNGNPVTLSRVYIEE